MDEPEHVLISLEQRHAENILSGIKQIELRRRAMRVEIGTVVWIYAKLPVGRVVGSARVSAVHSLAPSTLWRRFADVCGLTRSEFFSYFEGTSSGCALALHEPHRLVGAVSLAELRQASMGFQPPQFFIRLRPGNPLRDVMDRKGLGEPRKYR
ncbi:ASCH domain-containing protein [Paraburkholderia megapolitana]|nr:ASCH domain-containing protein [Paraburkholderia sp. CHISQ3]MCX4163695.1 ASCH domain-containing protein [Paraburkholderia megapolitana]MDN7159190.1 ASCH domain-containing protein [Paraburkholderia sp. CHISQ3]MDQ6496237.1 ASCH domain-containing protein [Paraburkholderia megapolitana]